MNRHYIRVLDMSKLFKKEIFLYSLFDLHFKTPLKLMQGVYFILLFMIWGLPLIYLFWPNINVYVVIFSLIIPKVGSSIMSKPIWGGKTFFAWFKTQIMYIFSPKEYYDTIARKPCENYFINHEYSVSRTRDFYKLLVLKRKENEK